MLAAPFTSTLAHLLGERCACVQGAGAGKQGWTWTGPAVQQAAAAAGRVRPHHRCSRACAHGPRSCARRLPGVVVGKLGSADEGAEASHVCTMAMEVLLALCNHEVRRRRRGLWQPRRRWRCSPYTWAASRCLASVLLWQGCLQTPVRLSHARATAGVPGPAGPRGATAGGRHAVGGRGGRPGGRKACVRPCTRTHGSRPVEQACRLLLA